MLEVKPVTSRRLKKHFIKFPWKIYKNDPQWVPPLLLERKQYLHPKKNPFFKEGDAEFFLAYHNGKPVGRISAHLFPRHNEVHQDQTGFFGFFESVHDPIVAKALVEAATNWLRSKGCDKMRGPMSFTINDEVGLLVDGFEKRPYLMMGHNPRYYSELLEYCGLQKIKDTFTWEYNVGEISPFAEQLAEATYQNNPDLNVRSINMKNFGEELQLVMSMFNEIWSQNWGFVPFSDELVAHLAKELKPILDPELVFIAFVKNDPAAFAMSVPNINEMIQQFNGRLFPFNWLRLTKQIIRPKWKTARMMALGVRKPYRGSQFGVLSVLMNIEMHRRGHKNGYQKAELGWTLEDNERVNQGIQLMGGKKYKTYRIYEKEIS